MVWHQYSKRHPIIGWSIDCGDLGFLAMLQHNHALCVLGNGRGVFIIPFTGNVRMTRLMLNYKDENVVTALLNVGYLFGVHRQSWLDPPTLATLHYPIAFKNDAMLCLQNKPIKANHNQPTL